MVKNQFENSAQKLVTDLAVVSVQLPSGFFAFATNIRPTTCHSGEKYPAIVVSGSHHFQGLTVENDHS